MSYNIDGKIANQLPNLKFTNSIYKVTCAKCSKLLPAPQMGTLAEVGGKSIFEIQSYIGTEYFIYESKSGKAVVYCSEYCRNKHNHRFNK